MGVNTNGDCFKVAGQYLIEHRGEGLVLVHGIVTGQGEIAGVRYVHAWIEDGDTVIDLSNGRDIRLPAPVYYKLGRVGKTVRYSEHKACLKMVETETFGSWDISETEDEKQIRAYERGDE